MSNPLQTRVFFFCFFFDLNWSVEENDTIMSKIAEGKNGKTAKCVEEQENESTYSFQNYDSKWLLKFLYQGWYLHKEKETSFFTSCLANFCLTATSLIEIWTLAWSSASASRFTKGFFSFLDRMVLSPSSLALFFFFPFFLPRTFLRFWFFHEERFFH